MKDVCREENLTTATFAVANPSHHFDRRLKINGGVSSVSSLPDEILHQILSFIPTKLAIKTSVLSKRWRHVWCETPCLYFHDLNSSSESISKTLASYSAPKIRSFRICTTVSNKERAQLVNSLIKFAMSHKDVEKISLEVFNDRMCYSFPDFLFTSSSLKQLIVDRRCGNMIPRCTVSWTSLRSLSLTYCNLSDESFSKILSGSPMLESLTLRFIRSLEYLDLSKSLRLKRLDINFIPWVGETMQIVAPHIYSLRLRNLRLRNDQSQSNCTLVDVSSLNEAKIDADQLVPRDWCCATNPLKDVVLQTMVQTMLEKLLNVENLTLGFSILRMLSIAEYRGVPFPMFKVQTLTLKTRILRSVVPGITRLLQNSPGLKKITLYPIKCNTKVYNSVYRYLDKQGLTPDQCWILKEAVSPASWKCEVAHPKLVGSFVKLLLANTRTLETLVLRLGSYFDKSRLGELSQITHTLSHNNKVSIVIK